MHILQAATQYCDYDSDEANPNLLHQGNIPFHSIPAGLES
jgi:hypothetical protein